MNKIDTTNHYYTKDFGEYRQTEDNFVANQELTVTITLNEYRNLIKEKAEADQKIKNKTDEYYEKYKMVQELKEEVKVLKDKIYKLQNPDGEDDLLDE